MILSENISDVSKNKSVHLQQIFPERSAEHTGGAGALETTDKDNNQPTSQTNASTVLCQTSNVVSTQWFVVTLLFSDVASPKVSGEVKYFDFKRATVSGLGHHVSKHKMTRYARIFWGTCPPFPLATPMLLFLKQNRIAPEIHFGY